MLNFARPQQLATKLLLRQNITSIRTDPFHLNCNGTILVDSIQHYASCVGLSPEDFMSESAKDCVVLQKGPLYLFTTILSFALPENDGRSPMKSVISAVDTPAMDLQKKRRQTPLLPVSCFLLS